MRVELWVVLTESAVPKDVVLRVVVSKGVSSKVVVRLVNNHFGCPGSLLLQTDGEKHDERTSFQS